jgi:hypothetical protein
MNSRLASFLSIWILLASTVPSALAKDSPKASTPLNGVFAPYFVVNSHTTSTINLINIRQDMDVTVTPTLLIDGKAVTLSPLTIPPRLSRSINIGDELQSRGVRTATGGVSLTYQEPTKSGAISAEVLVANERANLYFSSVAVAREEFMGTDLDAVLWSPGGDAHGFVALVNTSDAPLRITVTAIGSRGPASHNTLTIPAFASRSVALDDVMQSHDAKQTGTGLRVSFIGHPGDVIAEAFLYSNHSSFSKHIHFVDSTMHFENVALRTHFALFGPQPSGHAFPAYTSFRSLAVIRNFDSQRTVTVTPVLRTDDGTAATYLSLTPITLRPDASDVIDFTALQTSGRIPSDVHQASVRFDLMPSENLVVAELFNYDSQIGGYVVGPSFTAYPSRASVSQWKTDSGFETELVIENISHTQDTATVSLFTSSGSRVDRLMSFAPGELRRLRVSDLQQRREGDDGQFPLYGGDGTLAVTGAHGTNSHLVVERLIHSPTQAEYVGLPSGPCVYVTDIDGYFSGDSSPVDARGILNWSDGSSSDEFVSAISTSNSNLAQVNGGSSVSVDMTQPEGSTADIGDEKFATSCGNCSAMTISFTPHLGIKTTYYKDVQPANPFCFWQNTACVSGTFPTCTRGVGLSLAFGCPNFAVAFWLVNLQGTHNECVFALVEAAGGFGACS